MTWIIPVRRMGSVIVPYGVQARDDLVANVNDGQLFLIEGRSARNPRHLAKFWTLVNIVAQATDRTPEEVRRWISYKLAFVDTYVDPWGRAQSIPRSIALTASLSQAEFRDFFDRSVALLSEKLLGTNRVDLITRFEDVMEGRAQ
jgi:hypothetical protein